MGAAGVGVALEAPPLSVMTPETLTVRGAQALLDRDEDRGFLSAQAADHAAYVLPRVGWGHLRQTQPRAMHLGRGEGRQPQSQALGLTAGLLLSS